MSESAEQPARAGQPAAGTQDPGSYPAAGREHPRGIERLVWLLEHAQDVVSVIVGVLLVAMAGVVLVLGIIDFFRNAMHGSVETAAINLLDRILLVLILVEIMHTVVLSLRAHHLVAQPLLAVGLVAVIRKILFILSSEQAASAAELALLVAMIAVFVAALICVSLFDRRNRPAGSRDSGDSRGSAGNADYGDYGKGTPAGEGGC